MRGVMPFEERLTAPLGCTALAVLQVNVGRACNLNCNHCHLSCSPGREEVMGREVMKEVIDAACSHPFDLVDVTGGAPELNPDLPYLVEAVRKAGRPVQVRTNLVALLDAPEQIDFFHRHRVALVASLPCYLEENVQAQRGDGVYEKSVQCLQKLNRLGYGRDDRWPLHLVYNPGGASLPGPQIDLEAVYREELDQRFGIAFSHLYTLTNLPIGRFAEDLRRDGRLAAYRGILQQAFNAETLPGLMCRHQICVDWDGRLYDCDFNLALEIPVGPDQPGYIRDFDAGRLQDRAIVTGEHCYGCTAGAGSSCGGSLV